MMQRYEHEKPKSKGEYFKSMRNSNQYAECREREREREDGTLLDKGSKG